MKLSIDEICAALGESTPDLAAVAREELSPAMIEKYSECISRYQAGGWTCDGWLAAIENAMLEMGASKRLAFALAVARHRYGEKSEV